MNASGRTNSAGISHLRDSKKQLRKLTVETRKESAGDEVPKGFNRGQISNAR